MRKSCSFTTTAGKAIYTSAEIGLTDFGNWSRDTWRNYLTTTGTNSEIHMTYQDYESWRDVFQFGATRTTQTQPNIVTITPAKAIGLGPVPNGLYTVTGDYYSVPAELVQDTDTPALPAQFHMLIVYKAMMYYGVSEAAPEVYQEGEAEFNRMMIRLQLNQMPDIGAPAPLA